MKKGDDLLNSIFEEINISEGNDFRDFNNRWNDIVGDKIGRSSKIDDIIDEKLIIEIDHPGVKQLILFKEKYIISTINRIYPQFKVKKIKFIFKNELVDTVKTNNINYVKQKKSGKNSTINSDFSELLKKMGKRSEE